MTLKKKRGVFIYAYKFLKIDTSKHNSIFVIYFECPIGRKKIVIKKIILQK